MAINMSARQTVSLGAVNIPRNKQLRLAPFCAPRFHAPAALRACTKPEAPPEFSEPLSDGGKPPPSERQWLGAPRSFRMPHMGLPRVTLPHVDMPHWSIKVPALPMGELTELCEGAAQLLTLWNGPNVEDIRRFEGDTTQPHTYGWFQNLLTECALTNNDASRQHFLETFSAHGAPKLTNELAALEYFCMKTAYLRLRPGDRLRFCCGDYGWQTVTTSIRDFDTGLVAHVLTPDEAPSMADAPPMQGKDAAGAAPTKPPVLIVFRGTARVSNQPGPELGERPTGCQADLDWDGIGFHAFAANEAALLMLVRKYMAQGHPVVLAGHSLGGVFAARTMCALTPAEQSWARLRTFNASGLDPATRARAAVPESNLMVRHRDDKLPRAGGELLPGTLITTEPQNEAEALYPHGMPLMGANGLNGHPAKFTSKPTAASDMSRTLELGRKFLSLVAHDRVEI